MKTRRNSATPTPVFKQNAGTLAVRRPVSLTEAALAALAINGIAYLILIALGLLGLLFSSLPEPVEQPQVRFTFAPEIDAEDSAEAGAEGSVPFSPLPETAAADVPDSQASASLQTPQPFVPPSPQSTAAMSEPAEQSSPNPPVPIEQALDSEALEPPSEGVAEGAETSDATLDATLEKDTLPSPELVESASDAAADSVADAAEESLLPELDGGDFATLREPARSAPVPSRGVPGGPSLDQRISDFGRAVERFRQTSETSRPQQPRNVFEPDWSALPPTGQAIGNLMFESGDYDWEDYSRQIYFIIWRAWHNRLLARVDDFEKWAQQSRTWMLDHVNGVRFTIERSGEITGILLETESGAVPFDLSSVEGLDEAVLPPLPDDFPRDSEIVHAHFIGQGAIGNMRRSLQEYKRRGWF